MSVTQTYIDLLLPSLIESNYGTLSTTKTEEGLNAYSFSCPFCSKFVHSKKCKKTETASILPLKGVEKFKGYKWYFRCKRGYSPECRGGYKSFYNFLCMYDHSLWTKYRDDLNLGSNRNDFMRLYNKIK